MCRIGCGIPHLVECGIYTWKGEEMAGTEMMVGERACWDGFRRWAGNATNKNQYLLNTQSSGCQSNADSCSSPGESGLVRSVSRLFGFKTSLQRLGAEGLSDLAADSWIWVLIFGTMAFLFFEAYKCITFCVQVFWNTNRIFPSSLWSRGMPGAKDVDKGKKQRGKKSCGW